jgi:hypothetical protein
MDSRDITAAQAGKMHAKLVENARYLQRLRDRMVTKGFTLDDPLFKRVLAAQISMADLVNELHGAS